MRKLFKVLMEYGVEMTVTPIPNSRNIRVIFTKYPRRLRFDIEEVVVMETNVDLIATIILQKLEEFVKEFKEVTE